MGLTVCEGNDGIKGGDPILGAWNDPHGPRRPSVRSWFRMETRSPMAAILSQREIRTFRSCSETWQRHKGGRRQPNRRLTVVSSANAEQNLYRHAVQSKSCPRADWRPRNGRWLSPTDKLMTTTSGATGAVWRLCSFSLEHATQGPVHEVDDQAICRHSFLRATEAASLWRVGRTYSEQDRGSDGDPALRAG